MCKKLLSGMLAAAALLATSCIYDGLETSAPEEQSRVSFTLDLEGAIATRAISDGKSVNKLFYSIYKVEENENGEEVTVLQKFVGSDEYGRGVKDDFVSGATVTVSLAKEQTYRAVFWAQDAACTAYDTEDLTNVQIDYASAANNDENRDAFCAVTEFVADAGVTCDVVLRRPFAQVNVGVVQSDWAQAVASGVTVKESSVVIKNAATSLNLLTGAVGPETEDVEVSYTAAAIPAETLYVETDDTQDGKESYVWLSMSYILVADHNEVTGENGMLGDESATLESAEFTFVPENGTNIVLSDGLTNIPVQRNWRTNILGTILAGNVDFNITIDPAYYNDSVVDYPLPEFEYDEPTKTYSVRSAKGLAEVSKLMADTDEVQNIKLVDDIDFSEFKTHGNSNAPIGSTGERDASGKLICEPFKGTFDGDGHTISNIYQSGWDMGYEWGKYGSVGLFAELENATVKNVVLEGFETQVEGGDVSFIAGSATGTCVFENIEIKSGKIGTYNNGNGAIIGWSGAGDYTFRNIKIGSDVVLGGLWGSFDSSIGGIVGQAEPGATYNFENVEINCRIDAYNDCTASYDYYNYRMCGMIIGRCAKTISINGANYPDLSQYNMTFNNVVVNYGNWMNYHYCKASGRATRVEEGYAYGGLAADHDPTACTSYHFNCIPFDQLIGGDQYGVKGLREVEGVTVNYPAEYTCPLCGQQHNVPAGTGSGEGA